MPETSKSLLFFLEPRMARSVTGTIRSIRLGFVLSMSLVLSSTGSFAWPQPAFLNRPIHATFQGIPLARLISQLSTSSNGIVVLDRQIDPTQHVTLTCQGEDLLSVLLNLADETGTELAVLESSAWLVPIGKANSLEAADDERKAALQKLPAHTRRPLSIKQALQWQAGQKPTVLIEKLLARTKTDNLAVTPDDLSTVIPHDHLAAGSIPPLSLPEQLDLVAMQYNHHLLWKQNPQGASAVLVQFVPLPSRLSQKNTRPGRNKLGRIRTGQQEAAETSTRSVLRLHLTNFCGPYPNDSNSSQLLIHNRSQPVASTPKKSFDSKSRMPPVTNCSTQSSNHLG